MSKREEKRSQLNRNKNWAINILYFIPLIFYLQKNMYVYLFLEDYFDVCFYPVAGAYEVSKASFKPWTMLSSRVNSDLRMLSVFHFSKKVKPCWGDLYLASSVPSDFCTSLLCSPVMLKSISFLVLVFTSSLTVP